MKTFNQWPLAKTLQLDQATTDRLIQLLMEPFRTEQEAIEHWRRYPTQLQILTDRDGMELLDTLPESQLEQLRFGWQYPEFCEAVGEDYQLRLAILNDEGAGLYLLTHRNCPLLEHLNGTDS